MIGHLLRRKSARWAVGAGVVALALVGGLGGVLTAQAGSGDTTARPGEAHAVNGPRCIPYTTGRIPANTRCMNVPWLLEEAGPGARSVVGRFASTCTRVPGGHDLAYPSVIVQQTRSVIRIRAFVWNPHQGEIGEKACGGYSAGAEQVRAPIDGRRIVSSARWPSRLRFGMLRGAVLGLPRLLGLSPAQARRVLWLEGFHSRLEGRGQQVVSQLPGWGLAMQGRGGRRTGPYTGVATLRAGKRIAIPTVPALRPGARSGVLVGTVGSFARSAAIPVAVFDASGRLLARFRSPAQGPFRLRLSPGRYLLLADNDFAISCGPAAARVHAGQRTSVNVPAGCDVGGY
jgi:hypothetical protein